jgi:hypothetical protein
MWMKKSFQRGNMLLPKSFFPEDIIAVSEDKGGGRLRQWLGQWLGQWCQRTTTTAIGGAEGEKKTVVGGASSCTCIKNETSYTCGLWAGNCIKALIIVAWLGGQGQGTGAGQLDNAGG